MRNNILNTDLNIAILCPGYPASPEDYRGPFVKTMVNHLKKRGHHITVITPQVFKINPTYKQVDEREEIYRFKFWTEEKVLPEYKRIPILRMLSYFLSGIIGAWKIIQKGNYDIIHAHFLIPTGVIGAILGKLTNLPVVITAHGPEAKMALENPFLAIMARWALKHCELATTVADHVTKKCITLGMPKHKIIKIPMGINEEVFWERKKMIKTKLNRRYKKTIISTRSFVEPQYNVIQLIEALPDVFHQNEEVNCCLAGSGPEKAKLISRAVELGISDRIDFVGKQSPEQIAELLANSTVYVSTSRFDGASVSLFEAMACDSFPVVTDILANREWIKHSENGFLVKLEDSKDLADHILRALTDWDLRSRSALFNRKIIEEKVLWSKTIPQLEKAFLQCVSSLPPPAKQ